GGAEPETRVHTGEVGDMRVRSICLRVFVILCVALAAPAADVRAQARAARVGLVFDVGGRGDLSFNDMAYAGLERAAKTFGARIASKYLEPTAGGQNREELVRLLGEGKYDLIIGVGFLFTDPNTKVAEYVNPKVTVYADYAGTTGEAFKDPVKGKELALAQYDRGADVIYHASGATGIGVFEAAVGRNKMAIGVDADQSLTVSANERPHILTSMTKRVDVAVFDAIRALVRGSWTPGPQVFGLREGGVGYAVNAYNRGLLSPYTPKLEALKQDIVAGRIKVPANRQELQTFL